MELLSFQFKKDEPIYLQIYHQLVYQMKKGYIKSGDKLPSIRDLASQLHISKSTVENAYDRLLSEGYIISKFKSGYYCDIPEIKKVQTNEVMPTHDYQIVNYKYNFSSRYSDYSQFDQKVWIRYTKEVLENGALMSGYGEAQGEYNLRYELSNYLYASRGLHAKAHHLLLGAGISPLLYFICSLFKDKTLKIGFLKPGFPQAISVFEDCHHQIVLLDSLDDLNETKIDMLYLTPATLNLSMKHRLSLLQTLKVHNIYLIEDDLNGEMQQIPCMQGLLEEENVFYISSFSKLLLPSVRIALLAIPNQFELSFKHYNQTASRIEQQVFSMYLHDGHMHRRVKRLKRSYQKKIQLMQDILNKYFNEVTLFETNLYFEIDDDFTYLTSDHVINFQKIDNQKIRLHFGGINENLIEDGLYYLIEKWKSH